MFLGEEKGKRVNVERAEELVATGAAGDRHGLSLLPDDVPRCAGHGDADAAEAAGYRADRRGIAAAGTVGSRRDNPARNAILILWRGESRAGFQQFPERARSSIGRATDS